MDLIKEFYDLMAGQVFDSYGILDSSDKIHTLGTDSKIIGRIFEMVTQPILEEIAAKNGLELITPESQTVYPDFVMMKDEKSTDKIAIDIKTTYVNSDRSSIGFTLGSYASYIRNNTKNIKFKYTDYSKHYVIGFVYKRNDRAQESRVYDLSERSSIQFPYYDVKYFIQEKYKIGGEKTGSGNTENIGSFSAKSIEEFRDGKGPFSELGADIFDVYWKYYPRFKNEDKTYQSLDKFATWFIEQDPASIVLLHTFDYQEMRRRIEAYIVARGLKK